MEKKSLSNNFKHHIIGAGRSLVNDIYQNSCNVKDPWNCFSNDINQGGGDSLGGFSWPPRSYTCSFCKREFRSAQALGGHMNVHRRDRARLRQSPPREGQYSLINLNLDPTSNLNLNQNPNPNFLSSSQSPSPSTIYPPFPSTLPPTVSPSVTSLYPHSSTVAAAHGEIIKWKEDRQDHLSPKGAPLAKVKPSTNAEAFFEVGEFHAGFRHENECLLSKRAESVRLDLGIGLFVDSKEDLDLELRLGCS